MPAEERGIANTDHAGYTSRCNLTAISVTPQLPAPIERPRTRERLLQYLTPGLAALLVASLFTLAFFGLIQSRDARLRDAERTTRILSQIVEQRATAMLQTVDQTLRSASEMWQQVPAMRDPAGPAMHLLLAQKISQLPHARSLFVLDARAMLLQDSGPYPAASADFSDREFFNWHRLHV